MLKVPPTDKQATMFFSSERTWIIFQWAFYVDTILYYITMDTLHKTVSQKPKTWLYGHILMGPFNSPTIWAAFASWSCQISGQMSKRSNVGYEGFWFPQTTSLIQTMQFHTLTNNSFESRKSMKVPWKRRLNCDILMVWIFDQPLNIRQT